MLAGFLAVFFVVFAIRNKTKSMIQTSNWWILILIIFAFFCKKDFKSLGLVFCLKIFQPRILEKKDHGFHKKYYAATGFKIDNNNKNKCFLSTESTYYNDFWRIMCHWSKGCWKFIILKYTVPIESLHTPSFFHILLCCIMLNCFTFSPHKFTPHLP